MALGYTVIAVIAVIVATVGIAMATTTTRTIGIIIATITSNQEIVEVTTSFIINVDFIHLQHILLVLKNSF